jgi:hypothetical protein
MLIQLTAKALSSPPDATMRLPSIEQQSTICPHFAGDEMTLTI